MHVLEPRMQAPAVRQQCGLGSFDRQGSTGHARRPPTPLRTPPPAQEVAELETELQAAVRVPPCLSLHTWARGQPGDRAIQLQAALGRPPRRALSPDCLCSGCNKSCAAGGSATTIRILPMTAALCAPGPADTPSHPASTPGRRRRRCCWRLRASCSGGAASASGCATRMRRR